MHFCKNCNQKKKKEMNMTEIEATSILVNNVQMQQDEGNNSLSNANLV